MGVKPLATGLIGRLMVTDQLNFIWKHFIKCHVFGSILGCVIRQSPNSRSWVNLSDHRPLVYTIKLLLTPSVVPIHQHKPALRYFWRWDKSDLNVYYDSTYSELCTTSLPDTLVTCDYDSNICDNHAHCAMIDAYYNDYHCRPVKGFIFCYLRVPVRSLKPYWNKHLDKLKSDSIFWHEHTLPVTLQSFPIHEYTNTHTTVLRLCGICPGKPGWAGTRRTFTHYSHCSHQSSLSAFSI